MKTRTTRKLTKDEVNLAYQMRQEGFTYRDITVVLYGEWNQERDTQIWRAVNRLYKGLLEPRDECWVKHVHLLDGEWLVVRS